MSYRRGVPALVIAGAFLAACGHGDSTAPKLPPLPPAAWSKLAPLSGSGFGIAMTSDGHLLATLINSGWVERTTLANPTATHDGVTVGGTPTIVATDPTGTSFFVANMAGWVEKRSAASGTQSAETSLPDAHALAVSPDGKRVYVTGTQGEVYVLDASNLAQLATIPVPGGPWGIAFRQAAGSWMYVTSRDGASITEIDRGSNTVSRVFTIGGRPHGLVINAKGTRLYAADNQRGLVIAVDIGKGITTNMIAFPAAFGLAISPDGRSLWVSGDNGDVGVIDVATETVTQRWSTGGQARQIVVSADGNTAYMANAGGWIDAVTR